MTTPNIIYLSTNTEVKMQNHCVQTFSVFAGFLVGLSFPVQWANTVRVSKCQFCSFFVVFFSSELGHSTDF